MEITLTYGRMVLISRRLFESPVPSEFYVCFHDSAQQNVVEMAFKLMQGTLI